MLDDTLCKCGRLPWKHLQCGNRYRGQVQKTGTGVYDYKKGTTLCPEYRPKTERGRFLMGFSSK